MGRKSRNRKRMLGGITATFATLAAANLAMAEVGVYRDMQGFGNGGRDMGATDQPLMRMAPALYGDGLNTVIGYDGSAMPQPWTTMPNPRAVSNAIFAQSDDVLDPRGMSQFTWAWGQFVDHDITLVNQGSGDTAEMMWMPIPADDPVYSPGDMIPATRTLVAPGTGLTTPRAQTNVITPYLDGGQIYGGGTDAVTRSAWLRTFDGGRMRTSTGVGGDFLPRAGDFPGAPAMASDDMLGDDAFIAGDVRANEHAVLTSMHTVFVREHNRIAELIDATHIDLPTEPAARDQEIYDRARKIVGAEVQAITYNEWLPALGVQLDSYAGFDASVDPRVSTEFATAGFRVGHSMIRGQLLRLDENGQTIAEGNTNVADVFFNPDALDAGGLDPLLRGLAAQEMNRVDNLVIDDLRNMLFTDADTGPIANGTDLASLNILRGRDHGLCSYNELRVALGMDEADDWSDLTSDADLAQNLEALYGDIDTLDAWVGILSEDRDPDSSLSDTMEAIWAEQFGRMRDGDWFYFDNPDDADLDQWLAPLVGSDLTTREWLDQLTLGDVLSLNTGATFDDSVFFATPVPEPTMLVIVPLTMLLRRRRV